MNPVAASRAPRVPSPGFMLLRALTRPAVLASVALHAAVAGASYWFGAFDPPRSRPALLLGVEACELSGSVDVEAPPLPPEPPVLLEPIANVVPDDPPPEDVVDLPPDTSLDAVDPTPTDLDPVPVGVRKLLRPPAVAVAPPPAGPAAPAALPPPRIVAAAPSRRGARAETRGAIRVGNAPPPYPLAALAARLEGIAVLDVRVTAEGTVESASIYESSGSKLLDDASIAAVLTYRYLPRLLDGVPAPDWLRVPFIWRLQGT